jgi:hypothetical protein
MGRPQRWKGRREDDKQMIWDRSETLAMANVNCSHCHGYGLRPGRNDHEVPCNCVFRAIFRACYGRFRECASREKYMSRVSLEFSGGKDSRKVYGRKVEEYMADFCLVSRRALTGVDYDVFRFHFLLGADWKMCCRRLNLDRGTFFHVVYRIEQKLGRVFRELEPYSLFPLDEYFGGTMRNELPGLKHTPVVTIGRKRGSLRPPILASAA